MSDAQASLKLSLEEHLRELPVLPSVLASLLALDPRDEDYFDELVRLIEADPNFSVRILATANSAASASVEPIVSLRTAISRLGSRSASELVLALSVARVFVPRDDWEKSLWRHAIQVAVAARELAIRMDDPELPPNVAYTCGLLHDVGRFVMFQEAPDKLRAIDEGEWDSPEELLRTERQICGLTHADLGATACENWHLPDVLVRAIRNHHSPIATPVRTLDDKITAVIRISDFLMFPSAQPGSTPLEEASDETLRDSVQPRLPHAVSMTVPELRDFLRSVTAAANPTAEAIGIG